MRPAPRRPGSATARFSSRRGDEAGSRPLRASLPFLVIIDPIVSITLGVWLFGQRFTANGAVLAVVADAFAVMCGGVVVLTQTAPATMKADIPDDKDGGRQHGAASSQGQPPARWPQQ